MKKVGIITIFDLNNYGNRLQNYAMEQLIKKIGMNPTTIVLDQYDDTFKYSHKLSQIVKKVYSFIKRDDRVLNRYLNFLKFQNNMNAVVLNPVSIKDEYDFFVTGSDQVWHPEVINDDFFIKFAEKNKRIAIAPSFGVSEIPKESKNYYKDGLENLTHISVREEAGAKIIREMTNREVQVLADPVFLLGRSEWDKIAKKDSRLPDKYIVKYILGEKNNETDNSIEYYAKEHEWKVIDIYSRESEFFSMGPAEFVSAIKNASLVCTNSFHALAFSLIYEKDFVIFNRYENGNDMNSRVENLLAKFHMESRKIENVKNELLKCDFTQSNAVLCMEQKKFMDYLQKVME